MKQLHKFSFSEFFFDIPLYSKIEIQESKDKFKLEDIIPSRIIGGERNDFDGYNPLRETESTFEVLDVHYNKNFLEKGGYETIYVKCKRYNDLFTFSFFYNADENYLIKIGQYPSVADFHIYKIKQYDKLLSNDVSKEFTKAIGLAANGVGIGSFVYLRRIFENLILESFKEAKQEGKVEEETFSRSRMDEKIELLKNYLPSFLVENKSIYSILSKGIHELDENTCLEYFEPMKVGIEIILDQKLEKKKKLRRE